MNLTNYQALQKDLIEIQEVIDFLNIKIENKITNIFLTTIGLIIIGIPLMFIAYFSGFNDFRILIIVGVYLFPMPFGMLFFYNKLDKNIVNQKKRYNELFKNNFFINYIENQSYIKQVELICEYMEYNNFKEEKKEEEISTKIIQNEGINDTEINILIDYCDLSKESLSKKRLKKVSIEENRVINYYLNPPNNNFILENKMNSDINSIGNNLQSPIQKEIGLEGKLDILHALSEKTLEVQRI